MTHREAGPINAGDRLYDAPDLARFYDLENGWGADDEYCRGWAAEARSVLDLGCGTGRLAAALADVPYVVGVDPAVAMLDIARQRPGGERVTWVHADARDVRLERTFDLVLLTGHAFQVFLSHQDQGAVLRTIARHLGPAGRFIFDTRNPLAKRWLEWTAEKCRYVEHPHLGRVKVWNDADHDPAQDIVTYRTSYQVAGTGELFVATSRIRFISQEDLASLMAMAGLSVDAWLGDWSGQGFTAASPEIIPIGCLSASPERAKPRSRR